MEPSQNFPTPTPPHSSHLGLIVGAVLLLILGGATGYFVGYDHGYEKVSPTPTYEQTPLGTPESGNWETYRNTEYGFEFQYPEGESFSETRTPILYTIETGSHGIFWVQIDGHDDDACAPNAICERVTTTIAGASRQGSKSTSEFGVSETYVLTNNNYRYTVAITYRGDNPQAEQEVRDILATFKFIGTSAHSIVLYNNAQYGFELTLPVNWTGYSVRNETWEGALEGDDHGGTNGPMITIRHPRWTSAKQYQDVPVMIFTTSQWNSMQAGNFHIGAAPFNPSELARNAKYVFALPARWNYASVEGIQEAEAITQTFKAF